MKEPALGIPLQSAWLGEGWVKLKWGLYGKSLVWRHLRGCEALDWGELRFLSDLA